MEEIQMNNSKSRLVWLDLMKGLCMIMIVLSHTSDHAVIYTRLYSPVYLSAFFFASGYTFKPREDFKHYFIVKVRSLGIPFLCLGMINAFLAVVIEGDSILDRLKYLISLRSNWDDLWFIACLFSMQFVFYSIYRVANILEKKSKVNSYITILFVSFALSIFSYAIVSTTGITLPLQLENACVSVFSMAIGYAYRAKEPTVAMAQVQRGGVLAGLIYIIICILIPNGFSIHDIYYQSLLLYHIESILGIVALVSLCKFLESKVDKHILAPFVFIGQNTLVYYAFQSKGIKVFELIFYKLGFTSNVYLLPLIVSVLVCVCLAVPAYIIGRWLPFLLGKKHKRT